MGFTQVLSEYANHLQKLRRRTPGPMLNPKRAKVAEHCHAAIDKIFALGEDEITGEGFVQRTDAQLESGKGWAK